MMTPKNNVQAALILRQAQRALTNAISCAELDAILREHEQWAKMAEIAETQERANDAGAGYDEQRAYEREMAQDEYDRQTEDESE